ncbi:MAG: hypothetical protein KDA44_04410 [Planctomycetales bacterium]|nr:hypothetical protein [Planctomycetales bacterium]
MPAILAKLSNRWMPALLAAAILHQAGACPCGCVDGNLWVQQALQLFGQGRSPAPPASDAPQTPAGLDHSCVDAHLLYVGSPGSCSRTAARESYCQAAPLAANRAAVFATPHQPTPGIYAVGLAVTPAISAQSLRATLQVFLI